MSTEMKVIALNGSPRAGGNTDLLLGAAIEGTGADVTVFRLNDMNIRPCQNCGGCDETGICIIRDDMDAVYDAIRSADRIILASPIYFMALSAQTKAMMDRSQAMWCEKYLLGRNPTKEGCKGLLLVVGGMKRTSGVKCCETSATAFFRSIGVAEHESLGFVGIDRNGDMLKHPTALTDARQKGRALVT